MSVMEIIRFLFLVSICLGLSTGCKQDGDLIINPPEEVGSYSIAELSDGIQAYWSLENNYKFSSAARYYSEIAEDMKLVKCTGPIPEYEDVRRKEGGVYIYEGAGYWLYEEENKVISFFRIADKNDGTSYAIYIERSRSNLLECD